MELNGTMKNVFDFNIKTISSECKIHVFIKVFVVDRST